VRGVRPEDAEYPGAARELPRVWVAVRKNLRDVVEHVTIADVARERLPGSITQQASDPEAWVTRSAPSLRVDADVTRVPPPGLAERLSSERHRS